MIEFLLNLAAGLYLTATVFLTIFVSSFAVLLVIYLLKRNQPPRIIPVEDDNLLSVTVQLPVYNEPAVIDRLLESCFQLDYPADKLHIQVIDDSTDETSVIIRRSINQMIARGMENITYHHRSNREGFKAGALAYGMQRIATDCVVIFDADFVPESDFLRRTMPYFNSNPNLGLIQTRWSHLNVDYNLLTRAQALTIDAHFGVEQVARSRGHLPMAMNGTGGIWRVQTINDAGGWSSATLTEDLDLSYRAYIRGWEFLYLVDVAVPGELPPLVRSYKIQQARWATGSTQCLLQHSMSLIGCAHCSPLKKFMGMLHLAQYAIQPVILLIFLLTPVLLAGGFFQHLPNLTFIAAIGIIPPALIALAQIELYEDWSRRLVYFPVQFVAAVAIVLNNSRAVLSAIVRHNSTRIFQRTPKHRITRRQLPHQLSSPAPDIDGTIFAELLLAAYALFGLVIALEKLPAFAPYMLSYAVSFALFAAWNLHQIWTLRNSQALAPRSK